MEYPLSLTSLLGMICRCLILNPILKGIWFQWQALDPDHVQSNQCAHWWQQYKDAAAAAAAAESLQSCPTLRPHRRQPTRLPSPWDSPARTLEWIAISFSRKVKGKVKSLSRVRLFATPWTAAYQAPPSMGFSRQEYWSGVPLPSTWEVPSESLLVHKFKNESESHSVMLDSLWPQEL